MHDLHERPIEIGRLQGYATEPVVFGGEQLFERAPESGNQIAIVGAGPAGLSCAAELTLLGHKAVVFDAGEKPGGLNTFGIADYKMQPATSIAEVDWILSMGAELRSGVRIGDDVPFADLLDQFDGVFVGTGLGNVPPLGIPGEDLDGVQDALDFISDLKTRPRDEMSLVGERVAVIGGGNTAIDATIQAARLNADKVYLVYRRGREHMPAYEHEIQKALSDGAEIAYWVVPDAISGEGSVSGLRCRRSQPGEIGTDGRPRVEVVDGTEFELDVTRVLRATGQAKYRSFFETIPDLDLDDGGRVVVDEDFQTGNSRVWAGGDCVNGGKEVVNAVEHGKRAARHIDATLRAMAGS
jgi:glutamate synthase (NADPH/NADH) small chain